MVYEIYLDSIIAELLVWNCCVLTLCNAEFYGAAGRRRLLTGALTGAFAAAFSLLLPVSAPWKISFVTAGCALMLFLAFPVKGFRNFLRVLESYLKYALLLGGCVLLFLRLPPLRAQKSRSLWSLAAAFLMTQGVLFLRRRRSRKEELPGRALLIRGKKKVSVEVMVDSGNSLIEPVSGKPVCVLERETAEKLWSGQDLFRVIPYSAVGTEKGIMKGYLLPGMKLELGGPVRVFRDIYVAVSPQELTKEERRVQMLIHPALLKKEQAKAGRKR